MLHPTASLRWRLLMGSVAAIAMALLLAGWGLASLFRSHASDQFDQQLQVQLDQLTASLDINGSPRLRNPLSDPRWSAPLSGLYWQVDTAAHGQPAMRSRSLWDQALALPAITSSPPGDTLLNIPGPQGQMLRARLRLVHTDAEATGQPPWRLTVAADTTALQLAVDRFSQQLAASLAVLGLALALAAWVQVGLGLAPLQPLRRAVQAVRDGQAKQIPDHFPAEVTPLVQDFNRVLAQQMQGIERARHQAGNLAHALKTPLAILRQQIERPNPDPSRQAQQLQAQVQAVQAQVDLYLRRARAASGQWHGLRTPVQPVLEGLARVMRKVHAHRDRPAPLTITLVPGMDSLAFAGETQDLQEMAGNLLDNACKWARSQVQVSVLSQGRSLSICFDDDGPGLNEAQRQAVFARGFRADERTPGSGLGLAIALELAQGYGGHIALQASPLGGLRAELHLPALPPNPSAAT
jgi:signal transduction histidine kinase